MLAPRSTLPNAGRKSQRTTGTAANQPGRNTEEEPVRIWREACVLPTYLPAPPEKSPMFLEQRVYQGSSGRVYPLPFTDRIAEQSVERAWEAIWLENAFLRVMVLPELGGRVHVLQDRTNGYDLIYRQEVIKPALVGLAGPWISGGIEFNWPQHHRPGTFLPVDSEIERHADGSVTVWCGDHDPLTRMKGMHGVCLHPERAVLEVKIRAYNRTSQVQTFLWWANTAVRVHEAYQSFFPPDVCAVADHAKRAVTGYPLSRGIYYGVDYGKRARRGLPRSQVPERYVPLHAAAPAEVGRRPPSLPDYAPNDLSFYANIPVPTSYMCLGSREDFFGGYDYRAEAGLVHVANHHIAPGKKQWTWGNHGFGYAWDRNLTDPDPQGACAPYVELMAGVYTDNQPDFSFLQPGESKAWSQYWYPLRKIGPVQQANPDAAVALGLNLAGTPRAVARLGLCVTRVLRAARVRLFVKDRCVLDLRPGLSPAKPLLREVGVPKTTAAADLRVEVTAKGQSLLSYTPKTRSRVEMPPPATAPEEPSKIASVDELYVTGMHLLQYRHATRSPEPYWREGLRRDPGDARCNTALGGHYLRRGEFAKSEAHFRRAIRRLTLRNPNPYDGEPFFQLGWCLRHRAAEQVVFRSEVADPRFEEAYDVFYKATWNQAWAGAAYHALAEMDCCRGAWVLAGEHLDRSLQSNVENLRARNLRVLVLRRLGRNTEAARFLRETLAMDRLDVWARHLRGATPACDLQTRLDLAHDYARAGFWIEARQLLRAVPPAGRDLPDQSWGSLPLVYYTLGWVEGKLGNPNAALRGYRTGAAQVPDYCFPARLEEIAVLQVALHANPDDARAPYYLGNLLYDRQRYDEALRCWERAARLDPSFSLVWRNLGLGAFNVRRQTVKAHQAFDRAWRCDPNDARLLFERDQLWKREGLAPTQRLGELEKHPELVRQRDDLSVELCALYTQTGQPERALELMSGRHFQPWEGGEGAALGQYVRTRLALGRCALALKAADQACQHFAAALRPPPNLGEAKHLLANRSDVHYWLGCAHQARGDRREARRQWRLASEQREHFQAMQVCTFSEMTYTTALAMKCLGDPTRCRELLRALLGYARQLRHTPAGVDYFATSLPQSLLFDDDLSLRQQTAALFLEAQAQLGLGQRARGRGLLRTVLRRDPNHASAADQLAELDSPALPLRRRSIPKRKRTPRALREFRRGSRR